MEVLLIFIVAVSQFLTKSYAHEFSEFPSNFSRDSVTSDDNMSDEVLTFPGPAEITVTEVKVKVGSLLSQGKVILPSDWLTSAILLSDWLIYHVTVF